MTLRLVNDNDRNVVPCETGCGPATILVIINNTPGIPCCDECARRYYGWGGHTGKIRLAPMSEYVDMFAAAKEAAFATPEQITKPVQVTGFTAADDAVLRHIWIDQAVYCRIRWCEEAGRLTPADERLNVMGGAWYPACAKCIGKFDPSQVEVAPMSAENTAWELEMAGEYCTKTRGLVKPGPPISRKAKILWWAIPSGVLTLGITMVSLANKINNDYTVASDNWVSSHGTTSLGAVPSTGALTGFGIFFIVVSSLALAGVVITWMVCECTSVPAGSACRVGRR